MIHLLCVLRQMSRVCVCAGINWQMAELIGHDFLQLANSAIIEGEVKAFVTILCAGAHQRDTTAAVVAL